MIYLFLNENIQVFGAFGPVELVQLPPDETGNCKGFGFVQVSIPEAFNIFFTEGICSAVF